MTYPKLLVVAKPLSPYLKVLDQLPSEVERVVGNTEEKLLPFAADAQVILYCMNPGYPLKDVWHTAPRVKWIHSMAAGLESSLFEELVESEVPMTNSRGLFKESLGEFVVAAILYFAKDLRRMVRNQEAGRWEQFDVEMVSGKTLGIVGYGEIGRAAAVRAHALGMRVHAIRRRPHLSADDPIVEKSYAIGERLEMLSACDYVVMAAPLTAETRGLLGEAELHAMKKTAVLINVGRGPVIEEAALVKALEEGWIRGAALDVFDQEPLPEGHPFWKMDNLLLSPHCADHTSTWTQEAMSFFVENFRRYSSGEPLLNVVDKKGGY